MALGLRTAAIGGAAVAICGVVLYVAAQERKIGRLTLDLSTAEHNLQVAEEAREQARLAEDVADARAKRWEQEAAHADAVIAAIMEGEFDENLDTPFDADVLALFDRLRNLDETTDQD